METEFIVCANCLHENEEGKNFCEKCGAPIGDFTTILPLEKVQAEGFVWRQSSTNPNGLIVLVGMCLFCGTCIMASVWAIATSVKDGPIMEAIGGLFIGALSCALLIKTTRNYVKKHKSNQSTHSITASGGSE